MLSRAGRFTCSRECVPFLAKRMGKANSKVTEPSLRNSPIQIVLWVFSSEVKQAHFRSFIKHCDSTCKVLTFTVLNHLSPFFLCKEPCQREDNQLSFLLEETSSLPSISTVTSLMSSVPFLIGELMQELWRWQWNITKEMNFHFPNFITNNYLDTLNLSNVGDFSQILINS